MRARRGQVPNPANTATRPGAEAFLPGEGGGVISLAAGDATTPRKKHKMQGAVLVRACVRACDLHTQLEQRDPEMLPKHMTDS